MEGRKDGRTFARVGYENDDDEVRCRWSLVAGQQAEQECDGMVLHSSLKQIICILLLLNSSLPLLDRKGIERREGIGEER